MLSAQSPSTDSLYLDRCQVDTPIHLIELAWALAHHRRQYFEQVVDFGAGDGRFARFGRFRQYIGYEVDGRRLATDGLRGVILAEDAFLSRIDDADICIGNPPYVRNQDLPANWRLKAQSVIRARMGIEVSGLANAWQYFFLLGIASTNDRGMTCLVLPYEWVSRPSSKATRDYISQQGWSVSVYRLADSSFPGVLTTASITIVDKADRSGKWSFFRQEANGSFQPLPGPSSSSDGVLPYLSLRATNETRYAVRRGLSPGSQSALVLTEAARSKWRLRPGIDVVPAITSLRYVEHTVTDLDERAFLTHYVHKDRRCWLVRPSQSPSEQLESYLASVPQYERDTATCRHRDTWWAFQLPPISPILVAMSFKTTRPKALRNTAGVVAVGGVYTVRVADASDAGAVLDLIRTTNVSDRVVAHANGMRKIEVGQLTALIATAFPAAP